MAKRQYRLVLFRKGSDRGRSIAYKHYANATKGGAYNMLRPGGAVNYEVVDINDENNALMTGSKEGNSISFSWGADSNRLIHENVKPLWWPKYRQQT